VTLDNTRGIGIHGSRRVELVLVRLILAIHDAICGEGISAVVLLTRDH